MERSIVRAVCHCQLKKYQYFKALKRRGDVSTAKCLGNKNDQ